MYGPPIKVCGPQAVLGPCVEKRWRRSLFRYARMFVVNLRKNTRKFTNFVIFTPNFAFRRQYHYTPGDSLARGPKLLSIKNYVIEIMT